jgi:hypothetical protein
VWWSQCPLGSLNRAKGKESFPSLAFEYVTGFNWRIMGVYGPQFGLQNDKEIVKLDPAVHENSSDWLGKTIWRYFSESGCIESLEGMYLICDNGFCIGQHQIVHTHTWIQEVLRDNSPRILRAFKKTLRARLEY